MIVQKNWKALFATVAAFVVLEGAQLLGIQLDGALKAALASLIVGGGTWTSPPNA